MHNSNYASQKAHVQKSAEKKKQLLCTEQWEKQKKNPPGEKRKSLAEVGIKYRLWM